MVAGTVWLILTGDMVEIAMLITAGAFVLALAYLSWATWLTSRRDRLRSEASREGQA